MFWIELKEIQKKNATPPEQFREIQKKFKENSDKTDWRETGEW